LRLFRDRGAFGDALAGSSGLLYSICNADRFDPADLLRLERQAEERHHRDLLTADAVRDSALREVEHFFREAGTLDPEYRFAYSSGVVLAVPDYQDAQKIFLLRAHLHTHPAADVLMLVPDRRLHGLFADVFEGSGANNAFSRPVCRCDVALPGARAWARFARTLLRALANRALVARARVLVFTLSSGLPRAADAYFGDLAAVMGRKAPTLTVYLASGPALRLPREPVRVPFETFVSALDVIRAWIVTYASGFRAAMRPIDGELAPLHRHVRGGEIRSGEYFMQRLLARGLKRMIDRVSPEVLVYPFENRSFEKHLLAAARAGGVRRRVGYQHSSITPRHLALHVAEREIAREHLPDEVITIGDVTADLLRKHAPGLEGHVSIAVSLRTARQPVNDAKGAGVLVAISSSRNEALRLLQLTHAAASRVAVPFIVRTHPTIPIDSMFALFRWPPNVELSSGSSLAEDLSRATLVAYSSSTVALEGMLYGRLPIFVDIGDLPDGDAITGDHAFKSSARDGESLAAAVKRVSTLDRTELERLQNEARAFAARYLAAPTAEAVERMACALTPA
jgi:hypothetical protein